MNEKEKDIAIEEVNETNEINKKEKKNNKKKKIIIIASSITLAIGIFGTTMYGNINKAQNEFTGVASDIYSIEENIKLRNKLLLETKNYFQENNKSKAIFSEFEVENTKLNRVMKFADNTKEVNESIKNIVNIKSSVDDVINIYTNNEEMKKEKKLAEIMDEVILIDYTIESIIKNFNNEAVDKFNKSIDKQPVKLMQNKYDIEYINKIK